MISSTLPFLAALLHFLATPVDAAACSTAPCDDVHFFLARGNNEPYPGRQGALVTATCTGLKGCGYEDLIYSALYTDLSCQTTYDGAIAGHVQMAAYAARCPNSKLILAGYSQGAQIVTDILGGGGGVSFNGCLQPDTPALDRTTSPGSNIVAAIIFGNTRHTGGQSYNFGTGSSINGLFPRPATQLSAIQAYSGVLRDWCEQTDPICAANQANSMVATHLGYYDVDSNAAASWIKSVASLATDASFVTSVPISVSGYAQDYSTIGTATPSGTVTLNTAWTQLTAVVPCTTTAGSSPSSTSASVAVSSTSSTVVSSSSASSTVVSSSSNSSTMNSSSNTTSTTVSSIVSSATSTTAVSSTSSPTQVSSITTTSAAPAAQTTSSTSSKNLAASAIFNAKSLYTINVMITLFIYM